jgi:hypothetical protein
MSRGGDFWSRRRAAVAEEAAEDAAADAALKEAEAQAALEEKSDEEILRDLDLPDPDTMQPGQDIQAFMAKAVPERIRRRAMRQLWKLNPVLANVDGLVEYGEDFTDAATVIENLQTTYQVGRGMLAHLEAMAREDEKDTAAKEEPEELTEVEAPSEVGVADTLEEVATDPEPYEFEDEDEEPATLVATAPRRMRFAFEE